MRVARPRCLGYQTTTICRRALENYQHTVLCAVLSKARGFEGGNALNMRPVGIDVFAGAGGLSLGFEQAGFDIVAAVEVDPVHCAVHKFNFPNTTIIPRSVIGLSAAEIRETSGIGSRDVDCVFGGAPCQGFSLIGHRALDDPRNQLVREFVRIVAELGSRSFVFENVKGLTVGKHRKLLEELIQEFNNSGYECVVPPQVLNAGHYGTPQSRERLILMGVRKGLSLPHYPEPNTNIAGKPKRFAHLPYGPTCKDALEDLPDPDNFEVLLESDEVQGISFETLSSFAQKLRCIADDAWHFGYVREWDPGTLTSSARTVHTEISRRRFADTCPGTVEPISRFFKLSSNGVSNTLRAGRDGARGAFTSPRPIHYNNPRCVSVREMARLHGFPDWFRLHVTKWHGARQIGNAVPPPLARAIATKIMECLSLNPATTTQAIQLGDPRLLSLDMSAAADFFSVDAPPNRRDRRSGAKKRKQIDIEREKMAAARVIYG